MKYIITQEQLDYAIKQLTAFGGENTLAAAELRSLKPIEPLTDERIIEIRQKTPTKWDRKWADSLDLGYAIESAITGEQHE